MSSKVNISDKTFNYHSAGKSIYYF